MWTIESPIKAPKAKLKKNLIIITKLESWQHFLATRRIIAARNPIKEMPMPAKIPNPQI